MIRSFADEDTKDLFTSGISHPKLGPDLQSRARRKLQLVAAATQLEFLRIPPGNQLEKLKGKRKNQHSIRINDQWRICFTWTKEGPEHVEIVDYH